MISPEAYTEPIWASRCPNFVSTTVNYKINKIENIQQTCEMNLSKIATASAEGIVDVIIPSALLEYSREALEMPAEP